MTPDEELPFRPGQLFHFPPDHGLHPVIVVTRIAWSRENWRGSIHRVWEYFHPRYGLDTLEESWFIREIESERADGWDCHTGEPCASWWVDPRAYADEDGVE